jgi:hypothetical protein
VKRPKIGDVIEIDTGEGFAYAHYSHKNKLWGYLLRVYNHRYPERATDLAAVVAGEPTFYQFFPLGAAIHRGIFAIAGHVPLSEQAQVFPVFREGNPDHEGKIHNWWLWDGVTERRVGPLTEEIRKLSPLGVCNDTFLIDRILSSWTPETDPTLG